MGNDLDRITMEGTGIGILQDLNTWGIVPAKDLCDSAVFMLNEDPLKADSLMRMASEKLQQVVDTIGRLEEERQMEGEEV